MSVVLSHPAVAPCRGSLGKSSCIFRKCYSLGPIYNQVQSAPHPHPSLCSLSIKFLPLSPSSLELWGCHCPCPTWRISYGFSPSSAPGLILLSLPGTTSPLTLQRVHLEPQGAKQVLSPSCAPELCMAPWDLAAPPLQGGCCGPCGHM